MRSEAILHVGAEIALPMEDGTVRRCDVTAIDDNGFTVRFFRPDGVGPFLCTLPHAELPSNTIHRTLEGPNVEDGGLKQSWWKDRRLTHGEGTGEF